MAAVGSAATHNQKELKTKWPVTSGLIAGTTKQEGRKINLTSNKSNVPMRLRKGL
jgi:hypothetical protein